MSTNYKAHENEGPLLQAASNGDLEAFNQLVLTYQNMAYHNAYALLNDSALAEDATQESFLKAFQNMKTFRGGSFRGWLLKIVTNSAYDILRKSHRHPIQPLFPENDDEESESSTWLADPTASVQTEVERNEFSMNIYRMMDELPDLYRSVLTLIDLYELDYSETAEALDIPIGTVKSRLARARFHMKNKLLENLDYSVKANHSDAILIV